MPIFAGKMSLTVLWQRTYNGMTMKRDKDIDWVKALADLKAQQKRKKKFPPWLWGLLPFQLLGWCTYVAKMAPPEPKKASPPAWAESGKNAAIGQTVMFTEDCWGYATQELLTQACRAAGRHVETYAQHNRDAFSRGAGCAHG